jgi:hypothetical protein
VDPDIQKSKEKSMESKENLFYNELKQLLNKYSRENRSDTPDFLLAEYLRDCLKVLENTIIMREIYYGRYWNREKNPIPPTDAPPQR